MKDPESTGCRHSHFDDSEIVTTCHNITSGEFAVVVHFHFSTFWAAGVHGRHCPVYMSKSSQSFCWQSSLMGR